MSNSSNRVAATLDPLIFEIEKPADLPALVLAPDGVMRSPLVLGAEYRFRRDMVLPRLWWPATTTGANGVVMRGDNSVVLFLDGDSTPHIWGRDIGNVLLNVLQFVDIGGGGGGRVTRLYDLVGASDLSFLVIGTTSQTRLGSIGTFVDLGYVQQGPVLWDDVAAGAVIRSTAGFATNVEIQLSRIENSSSAPDMNAAAFSFIGGPPSALIVTVTPRQGKPANSLIFIDSASTGSYSITSNHYLSGPGFGNFFRPSELATITAQADVSITITSFSDSVTAPGVDTTVNFAAIVDVKRGDVHLISGELAYDGVHAVVRVAADLRSFDIAVVHSTSGVGSLDIVEHTVSGIVAFVEGETVVVAATTDYNSAAIQLLRRTSDTTFTLPQTFVSSPQAGTASSDGKDQTQAGVIATGNAEQEDSTVLGEACWNGNVAPTTIIDGTYVPLALTGVMLAPGEERVTLVDAATARLRNDSEAPIRLSLVISLFAEKGPAPQEKYRIALSKNGATPVFASAPYAPLELQAIKLQIIYLPTIQLDPGDEVQPVAAGDGSTVAVTFTDGQFIMRL